MTRPMSTLVHILLLCTVVTTISGRRLSSVPVRRGNYGKGKITDITHMVTTQLPAWGSKHGTGEFLQLVASKKNGSDVNASEMKLSTHTGTHIDAPSHVFEEYYEAGFDITTIDLKVLNDECRKLVGMLTIQSSNVSDRLKSQLMKS